jgi:hypothetical protein
MSSRAFRPMEPFGTKSLVLYFPTMEQQELIEKIKDSTPYQSGPLPVLIVRNAKSK